MITADVFYLITAEKQRLSEGDATGRQHAHSTRTVAVTLVAQANKRKSVPRLMPGQGGGGNGTSCKQA